MKSILSVLFLSFVFISCSNNQSASAGKTFCDTSCNSDTLKYNNNHKLKPFVTISVKNCAADTITWGHDALLNNRQLHVGSLLGNIVRLHTSAVNCFVKDTSYAWLSFNDCLTGRGYLVYLPYNKRETVRKMSSALNSFDKKFVVPEDLRAYCDYTMVYVEDIHTGKKEQMTFKEEYKIDFNNIHEAIDSVNISRNRIFVQLIKNGQKVPLEKTISL